MTADARSSTAILRLTTSVAVGLLALTVGCRQRDSDLELERAQNAMAQGRHDWARMHFERDLELHPDRLESLRMLGISWLSGYQRSLTRGIAAYRVYLDVQPDDVEIRQRLVAALLLAGEWEAARVEAGALDDSADSERLRARVLLDSDPAAARLAIESAFEKGSDSAESHALAAQILERLRERQLALEQALEALRLNPLDFETRYLAARLYAALGDRLAADNELRLHGLASRVRHDGTMAALSPEDELEVLDELAAAAPGAEDGQVFRRQRAEAAFRAGQRQQAIQDIEWLRAHAKLTVFELLEFARWADTAGLRSVARDLLARAEELAPNDRGVLSSLAILDLGSGHLERARERLSLCLADNPAQARCHLLLARVELAESHETAALDRFSRALELAPWEASWRVEWAEALLAAQRRDDVLRVVAAAPEEAPELEALRARHASVFEKDS